MATVWSTYQSAKHVRLKTIEGKEDGLDKARPTVFNLVYTLYLFWYILLDYRKVPDYHTITWIWKKCKSLMYLRKKV